MAYNLLASVLRSLGDGTTPLVAMGVACAVNIGLDLLFVAAFHWGIGGAAGATVTAQLVSCLYCAYRFRKLSLLKFSKEDWRLDRPLLKKLFSLGSPLAVQNMVIHIGGMVLQSIINTYGVAFLAGFTATNKLYGALELAAIAFGYSIATYTGQNMGAEKSSGSKGNPRRDGAGYRHLSGDHGPGADFQPAFDLPVYQRRQ